MIVRNASGGGGVKLPVLTNPADAGKIIAGYEAIDGKGAPFTGSLGAGIINPAGAGQIFSGYEAIGKSGDLLKGVAGAGITSPATAAKIALGFQAINGLGELMTGTLVPYYFNSASHEVTRQQDGRAWSITLATTGAEIVLAMAWRIESGYDFEVDIDNADFVGTMLERTSYGTLSYSGNTLTLSVPKSDSNWGDDWYIYAFSK